MKYIALMKDPEGLPRAWGTAPTVGPAVAVAEQQLEKYRVKKRECRDDYLAEADYTLEVKVIPEEEGDDGVTVERVYWIRDNTWQVDHGMHDADTTSALHLTTGGGDRTLCGVKIPGKGSGAEVNRRAVSAATDGPSCKRCRKMGWGVA